MHARTHRRSDPHMEREQWGQLPDSHGRNDDRLQQPRPDHVCALEPGVAHYARVGERRRRAIDLGAAA